MAKDVEGAEGFPARDYQDPPPTPFFDAEELTRWSLYRAVIAEFVATLLFLYVTVLTVIGYTISSDKAAGGVDCGGVGILGIAWAFGGMIFILVYCTAGILALMTSNNMHDCVIERINIKFPYEPYPVQQELMGKVILTLNRARAEGHSHALLESPTGTGKSLAMLCSVLAWHSQDKLCAPVARRPKIFFATRTHSQISELVKEYRKSFYRVKMCIMGSRKLYCNNPNVREKQDVDEECKKLTTDFGNLTCSFQQNAILVKRKLRRSDYAKCHDIEDFVDFANTSKGCPYFAMWELIEEANLIFCPYSYILNPVTRGGLEKYLKGAIIVFDEAHNLEDFAREAGSIDMEEQTLCNLEAELKQMQLANQYQPLHGVVAGLIEWIRRKKDSLVKQDDSQHYFANWTGEQALRELEQSNITQGGFPDFLKQARKAIRTPRKQNELALSAKAVLNLEGLLATLEYFFTRDGIHMKDYQFCLQGHDKIGDYSGTRTHTLSLWCMNPSVVFKDLAELSLSIILTSGTLSPMESFSSELGIKFDTILEASHVINVDNQVWAGAIFNGPGNQLLNASYKKADEQPFQDALGKALEEICNIVPGGSLVFFPSYRLMEILCKRWKETGQWSQLGLKRKLFVEPRGTSKDNFGSILKGYYESILGLDNSETQVGATFLAVCRGKVAEGIDFKDGKARAVIIVGVPFPSLLDIKVRLKKAYNDRYKNSSNLLGGNDWYHHQAFQVVNQAVGRCIRHRLDFGAIILLDARYGEERNRQSISQWLRRSIKQYGNFEQSLDALRPFFKKAKEYTDMLAVAEAIDWSAGEEEVDVIEDWMQNYTTPEEEVDVIEDWMQNYTTPP